MPLTMLQQLLVEDFKRTGGSIATIAQQQGTTMAEVRRMLADLPPDAMSDNPLPKMAAPPPPKTIKPHPVVAPVVAEPLLLPPPTAEKPRKSKTKPPPVYQPSTSRLSFELFMEARLGHDEILLADQAATCKRTPP